MTPFSYVVLFVGACLLLLGGFSGYALLRSALNNAGRFSEEPNTQTLWGLFVLGVSLGLVLIGSVLE